MSGTNSAGIEIITLTKRNGRLTKHIWLDTNGKLVPDGSACMMSAGTARRTELPDMTSLASHISSLGSSEAIALGRLKPTLPDKVTITIKAKLNGGTAPDVIARTGEFIEYAPGVPALLLIDVDHKGMPDSVRARVEGLGGVVAALVSVVPELGICGCVVRRSTTTGLTNTDTGEALPGSEGRHIYVYVADGADIERALRTLHDRCWLAGLGWLMVGTAGQHLDRSLVDRMVGAPERLVFEAAPVIDPPLVQAVAGRKPQAREGKPLDTRAVIPDLTLVEHARLAELKAAERERLKPECARVRDAWVGARIELLVERGVMPEVARQAAERAVDGGVLLPDFVLPFDLPEFTGCTVRDVLADPERFVGATLADPLEGVEYGRDKAKIMLGEDGTLVIHSFAHGRMIYRLKLDADAVREQLAALPDKAVIPAFVRFHRRMADLADLDMLRIRKKLLARLKLGVTEFKQQEQLAHKAEVAEDARMRALARQRRRVAAGDFRPQVAVPPADTPYLGVIAQLDEVFAASDAPEPPMRDIEGSLAAAMTREVDGMHLLTAAGANAEEMQGEPLPPPEHALLTKLTNIETAETIERYIDYQDADARSVRLPSVFVNAYRQQRFASPLPIVTSVATMPVILPDGTMLSGHHLDRGRRILFRVPAPLEALLPAPEDCTPDAIAEAMAFLTGEWLVDVPCSYTDKAKLIALTMTILERSILPMRPGYVITAGRRGSGKTTVLMMLALAALGEMVSASAWSAASEERRKALLAYMGAGIPLIAWDNIPRGSTITCPHIDRALTSHTYTDRILGETENRTVPASTVHAWTGNNITPRGDTSSRSLIARLEAARPDPENRSFKHADPIAWTNANRGRILWALYTIMLGNPRLTGVDTSPRQTRFKVWWHVIGAALEYAALYHRDRFAEHDPDCPPVAIAFKDQFLSNDDDDEHDHALAIALRMLHAKWPGISFTAANLTNWINDSYDPDALIFSREFLPALDAATERTQPKNGHYSTMIMAFRLRAIVDAPTKVDDPTGGKVLCLRFSPDHEGGIYTVKELSGQCLNT